MTTKVTADINVTVIGLGAMGMAMARCLSRTGFAVHGRDVAPAAVQRATADGLTATLVDDAHPLNPNAEDVIVTSVPADAELRQVAQRLSTWQPTQGRASVTLVDTSTVLPTTIREVATTLSDKMMVVDAAVSGGPDQAAAGTLTMYVGGAPAPDSAAARVLNTLAGTTVDCGGPGDAKLVKLLNNTMSWANTAVAAEVMALGVELGLDSEWLYGALEAGNGRSHQFEKRFGRLVKGDDIAYFTLAMGIKDVRLTASLAAGSPSPTPLTTALLQALRDVDGTWANHDIAATYHHYRHVARETHEKGEGHPA